MAYLADTFSVYPFRFCQEQRHFLANNLQNNLDLLQRINKAILRCSLMFLDIELYFCVETHKQ